MASVCKNSNKLLLVRMPNYRLCFQRAIFCISSDIFFRSKSCKSLTIPPHVRGYAYVPCDPLSKKCSSTLSEQFDGFDGFQYICSHVLSCSVVMPSRWPILFQMGVSLSTSLRVCSQPSGPVYLMR